MIKTLKRVFQFFLYDKRNKPNSLLFNSMRITWVMILLTLWIFQGGGSYAFIWAGLPGFLPLYFFQSLSHRLFFLLGSIFCFLFVSGLSKTVIRLKGFKVWLVFFFLLSAISILYNVFTIDTDYNKWRKTSEHAMFQSQAYERGEAETPFPSKKAFYKLQVIPYSLLSLAISFYIAQIISIIVGLVMSGIKRLEGRRILKIKPGKMD